MKVRGQFHFLGTGSSMGVPIIGCDCVVCQSTHPENKRLRPSILLTVENKQLLIDCGPDFKQQALHANLSHIDGLIFTHAHNDHTAGIDDLRVFCLRSGLPIPCLLSSETEADLRRRFYYMFDNIDAYAKFKARFDMQNFDGERGVAHFQNLVINYFSYRQIGMLVMGLRFGNLAYVTDIRDYPETIFEDLKGVDTLILSALRFSPNPMHFSVDEAIDFSKKVGAKKTWLMHIAHEIDHEKGNAYLPENIRLAYDGLKLDFQAEMH